MSLKKQTFLRTQTCSHQKKPNIHLFLISFGVFWLVSYFLRLFVFVLGVMSKMLDLDPDLLLSVPETGFNLNLTTAKRGTVGRGSSIEVFFFSSDSSDIMS